MNEQAPTPAPEIGSEEAPFEADSASNPESQAPTHECANMISASRISPVRGSYVCGPTAYTCEFMRGGGGK